MIESERTRELREMAERTIAAARLRERMRFHDKYGYFVKCSTCGGYGSRCGHLTPVEHGYSIPVELIDNSERIDAVLKRMGYMVDHPDDEGRTVSLLAAMGFQTER